MSGLVTWDDSEKVKFCICVKYGGFGLSEEAVQMLMELGVEYLSYNNNSIDFRSNPRVIEVIEQLGLDRARGDCCKLKIIEVPKELIKYVTIHEYDGLENWSINFDEAYADLLHKIMNGEDVENLRQQYEQYNKYNKYETRYGDEDDA